MKEIINKHELLFKLVAYKIFVNPSRLLIDNHFFN